MRSDPIHRLRASLQVLTTGSRIYHSGVLCWSRSPFEYATYETTWVLIWCCLRLATVYVVSGASWEALSCFLWLTLGNLFGTPKWSIVHSCLCWPWLYAAWTKLHTTVGFYQELVQGQFSKCPEVFWDLPPPASAFWLPIRLNHLMSLWQYSGFMK